MKADIETLLSLPSETGQITYEALLEANARQAQWITDLQGDIATLKEKFEDAWGRWVAAEKEIVRLQALPSAIEPIEVCSALRWTMETLEGALSGRSMRNADEVLSNAKRVLEKWEAK